MSGQAYLYVGLDVHKKVVAYCVKRGDGEIVSQGKIPATRSALRAWAEELPGPWLGVLEATMFTGWIYDFLGPYAQELKVAHPQRLKAISTAKKKNDAVDAATLADLLRCNLVPECTMQSEEIREARRVLRYRNLLVREAVRMKNKTAGLLMECGIEYDSRKLHGKRYFNQLLHELEELPKSVRELLLITRTNTEMFQNGQKYLLGALKEHPRFGERVERLMSIPGIGLISALTWALEVGDPHRFPSVRKAISYCGFCSRENSSAGKNKRGPISKQRNKHLQTVLVEAAKQAPRWNPPLKTIYERERARGHANRATLAVARKLIAYLLCVDKSGKEFELKGAAEAA